MRWWRCLLGWLGHRRDKERAMRDAMRRLDNAIEHVIQSQRAARK